MTLDVKTTDRLVEGPGDIHSTAPETLAPIPANDRAPGLTASEQKEVAEPSPAIKGAPPLRVIDGGLGATETSPAARPEAGGTTAGIDSGAALEELLEWPAQDDDEIYPGDPFFGEPDHGDPDEDDGFSEVLRRAAAVQLPAVAVPLADGPIPEPPLIRLAYAYNPGNPFLDVPRVARLIAADPYLSKVFLRHQEAVYTVQTDGSRLALKSLSAKTLRGLLSQRIDFVDGGGSSCRCPQNIAEQMHGLPPLELRRVSRVVHVPLIGADGRPIAEPGLYGETLIARGCPGDVPTYTLDEARAVLDDLFVDFAKEGDMVPCIAAMLLPLVRGTLLAEAACAPALAIWSCQGNSGKGLLAKTIMAAVAPDDACTTMAGLPDLAEQRRAFVIKLGECPSFLRIDNVDGEINSPVLEALITEPTFSERVVRSAAMPEVSTRVQFILTGNAMTFGGMLGSRMIVCRLRGEQARKKELGDAPFVRPGEASIEYARSRRLEVLGALVAMVRTWLDAGRPQPSWRFERALDWTAVIGGILAHAGYDLAPSLAAATAQDTDSDEVAEVLGWLVDNISEPYDEAFKIEVFGEALIDLGFTKYKGDDDPKKDQSGLAGREALRKEPKWLRAVAVRGEVTQLERVVDKEKGDRSRLILRRL
jgi:hypothetical protein